jgi:hypothetical protein
MRALNKIFFRYQPCQLVEITDVSRTNSVPIVMVRCDIGSKPSLVYTNPWPVIETKHGSVRLSVFMPLGQKMVVSCGDIKDFATVGIFLQLLVFLLVTPCVFFFSVLISASYRCTLRKKGVGLLSDVRIVL